MITSIGKKIFSSRSYHNKSCYGYLIAWLSFGPKSELLKKLDETHISLSMVWEQGAELGGFSHPSFGDLFSKFGEFFENLFFAIFNEAPYKKFASAHPMWEKIIS